MTDAVVPMSLGKARRRPQLTDLAGDLFVRSRLFEILQPAWLALRQDSGSSSPLWPSASAVPICSISKRERALERLGYSRWVAFEPNDASVPGGRLTVQNEQDRDAGGQSVDSGWSGLCRTGGVAALVLIVYSLGTIVQLVVVGGQPATAAEAFTLLQNNKILGLLRLDLPTVVAMPLYYFLFLGLFAALRRTDRANATLSTALAFVGVTLVLATPTALSMTSLSEKHAAATTEAMRIQLQAAGEAILATDIWHGTGALMGGILLQSAAVLISVVMLRSRVFGGTTAYLGILMHGLDLAHIVFGLFLPVSGVVLMAIAGPFYPIWFFLVGRRLLELAATGSTRGNCAAAIGKGEAPESSALGG